MNKSTVHNHPGLHVWHCPHRVFSLVFTVLVLVLFRSKQEQMQTHPKARRHAQVAEMSCGLSRGRKKKKNSSRTHKEQVGETWQRPQCSARHLRASPLSSALNWALKNLHWALDFLYFSPEEERNNVFTTEITISAIIGKLLQIKLNWHSNWSLKFRVRIQIFSDFVTYLF